MKRKILLLMAISLLAASKVLAVTPITLAKGSNVGLYISYDGLKTSENYFDNACLTFDGSGWKTDTKLKWKDQTSYAEFYVYYPYIENVKDARALSFSVKEDQSSADAFAASDFLYGRAGACPDDGMPKPSLRHMFSNIRIKVKAGNGLTDEELKQGNLSVRIKDVCTQAMINLGNGEVRSEGSTKNIKTYEAESLSFSAVIVPQRVGKLSVIWNNIEYVISFDKDCIGGKVYTLTATLKKTSGGINVSIGGWEDSGEDFGGTVN